MSRSISARARARGSKPARDPDFPFAPGGRRRPGLDASRSAPALSESDASWLHAKMPRLDAFDLLPAHAQAALAAIGQVRRWREGEVVQLAGEVASATLLVRTGRLRLSTTSPDGAEILWPPIGPGKMVCLYSAVGALPFHYDVVAAVDCTLVHFEAGAMLALMANDGRVATEIAKLLAKRAWNLMDWRVEGHHTTVPYRVYATLQYLATQRGFPSPLGVDVRMSQQELANLIGCSRPHLSACLQQLQEAQLVRLGYRSITVLPRPSSDCTPAAQGGTPVCGAV